MFIFCLVDIVHKLFNLYFNIPYSLQMVFQSPWNLWIPKTFCSSIVLQKGEIKVYNFFRLQIFLVLLYSST